MGKGEGDAAHPPGLDPNNPDDTNRDPNNLNEHVKVMFEDIFGEPEGAHSIDCVWKCSYGCYNCSKNCCYKFLTILCAIPVALCWGFQFAYLVFEQIWYIRPCVRQNEIVCNMCTKFYGIYVHCCCDPCCEAVGLIFNAFRK